MGGLGVRLRLHTARKGRAANRAAGTTQVWGSSRRQFREREAHRLTEAQFHPRRQAGGSSTPLRGWNRDSVRARARACPVSGPPPGYWETSTGACKQTGSLMKGGQASGREKRRRGGVQREKRWGNGGCRGRRLSPETEAIHPVSKIRCPGPLGSWHPAQTSHLRLVSGQSHPVPLGAVFRAAHANSRVRMGTRRETHRSACANAALQAEPS